MSNKENNKEFPSVGINWDNTANAKLPKSVQKWTLYNLNIFRDLIQSDHNPSHSTEIN